MFGSVAKSWFAKTRGIDPHSIYSVEIIPCVAKKAEVDHKPMNDACGDQDVDLAIITRELGRMTAAALIVVDDLEETLLNQPLGTFSGTGVIFGTTGGVMEAAFRTVHHIATSEDSNADAFKEVRGMDG